MTTSIVILTGAGISAESGLKTFRDNNGLWENHRVEDVATPEAFHQNPALVYRFYNLRRQQLLQEAQPNLAHRALADFQQHYPGRVTLITQNVDDLHERGGSPEVLHMHGELLKSRCCVTGQIVTSHEDITSQSRCPCCQQAGNLRPHIVWFGEMPLYLEEIDQALSNCGLFIAIGTSGNVYPAAGFFQTARYYGAHTVELNMEASANAAQFDEVHYGPATEVVPAFFQRLLQSNSA